MLKIIYIIAIILNLYLYCSIKVRTGYRNVVIMLSIILFGYLLIFN